MSQKNILMFCRLYWPHGGGVEKHVEKLSEELIARGHTITIVTEQYDPSVPLEETKDCVTIIRIPYFALNSKRSLWTWMGAHENLIEQADRVHIHDVFWWYAPTKLLFPTKPVSITFHGYEGNNPPTWRAVVHRKIAELMCNGSICVGDFMRKWYRANPTMVTYGAADCTTLSRCTPGSPLRRENHVTFLGRDSIDTGLDVYLAAMEQLPDFRLDVYSDSEREDFDNVAFHGWEIDLSKVMKHSTIAFVSRYLSILEAMQAKQLVAAVYNNQIKHDYLTCHPAALSMIIAGTADELVEKLLSLTIKQKKVMVETAYAWAKDETWQKMADRYEELWKQ